MVKTAPDSKLIWFYHFDYYIIAWICIHFLLQIVLMIGIILISKKGRFIEYGEIKKIFLNQFKGLNIIKKELPNYFDNLSEKEKNEFIFKKKK